MRADFRDDLARLQALIRRTAGLLRAGADYTRADLETWADALGIGRGFAGGRALLAVALAYADTDAAFDLAIKLLGEGISAASIVHEQHRADSGRADVVRFRYFDLEARHLVPAYAVLDVLCTAMADRMTPAAAEPLQHPRHSDGPATPLTFSPHFP